MMQKKLIAFSFLFAAIFNFKNFVAAQSDAVNIVTTAVPFLRISPDARSGGMGDAGIAISPDANSGFWNLAKTPFATTNNSIGLTYTPWLKDIAQDVYLATLSGYHKLDEDQAFSASLRYFNLGSIQFTDYNGTLTGNGRPREFAVDLGYSRKIAGTLGIGVALRYINSALANGAVSNGVTYKAGNAIAADLSLYGNNLADDGSGLTYGISLSNLGSKIGYTDNALSKDYIPANLGAGIAYSWVFQEDNKFTLTADVNKLLVPAAPTDTSQQALDDYHSQSVFSSWFKSFSNSAYAASIGAEYTYVNQFSLRAGYYKETQESGNRSYLTAGVGLTYNIFTFNFSYLAPSGNGITRNPLSNTLRFGIIFNLDEQDQQ